MPGQSNPTPIRLDGTAKSAAAPSGRPDHSGQSQTGLILLLIALLRALHDRRSSDMEKRSQAVAGHPHDPVGRGSIGLKNGLRAADGTWLRWIGVNEPQLSRGHGSVSSRLFGRRRKPRAMAANNHTKAGHATCAGRTSARTRASTMCSTCVIIFANLNDKIIYGSVRSR